ncbi:uncharacterized protein LOC110445302 [Mizuhopecten yessoensis]|uniref:uncharacterized protein LOC110445302 n=1 Tax=Mizuhopecten yessoensis TaxID=6573 RepID=UPI000B45E9A7|nr:uncharacterized protein LOC110445302 [Mizuhopecten yessoensis]
MADPGPMMLELSQIESSGEYRVVFKLTGNVTKETTCSKETGDLLLNTNTDHAAKPIITRSLLKKAANPSDFSSKGSDQNIDTEDYFPQPDALEENPTDTGAIKFIWSRQSTSILLDQVKEKDQLVRAGKMTKKRM